MQPVVMRVVKSGLRGQRAGSAVLSIAVARQSYHCMRCAHMPHHHVLAHHQGLGLGLAPGPRSSKDAWRRREHVRAACPGSGHAAAPLGLVRSWLRRATPGASMFKLHAASCSVRPPVLVVTCMAPRGGGGRNAGAELSQAKPSRPDSQPAAASRGLTSLRATNDGPRPTARPARTHTTSLPTGFIHPSIRPVLRSRQLHV